MSTEKLTIELEDGRATVTSKVNGLTNRKLVSLSDVQNVFKDKTEHDTGDLPVVGQNIVGIRRIFSRGDRGYVLANGVGLQRNLKYGGNGETVHPNVHLPGILLAFKYEKRDGKYQILDTHAFGHEGVLFDESNQLYVFPFGNVYGGNNCRVCWGSVNREQLDAPGQAIGLLEMFVGSSFNGDLYSQSRMTSRTGAYDTANLNGMMAQLSRETQETGAFPYEELKMKRKMTYREFVNFMKNNI